jgi:hypothetical protein
MADEVAPDGRARDMSVAAAYRPAFNTMRRPLVHTAIGQDDDAGLKPDVGKNHDLADMRIPVTTTKHLTQRDDIVEGLEYPV